MLQEAINKIQYNIALSFDILLPVSRVIFLNGYTPEELRELRLLDTHFIYDNVAFERKHGLDIGVIAYYNGGFHMKTIVINDNRLLAGNQGPTLPANCVTVFAGALKTLEPSFDKLHKLIQRERPEFKGFICLEVTATKRRSYYRLIDFNPPIDYIKAIEGLTQHNIDTLVQMLDEGELERPQGYGVSTRIYSYPYTPEDNFDLMQQFNLELVAEAGSDSLIVKGGGPTIKSAWANLHAKIPKNQDICYRIDADKFPRATVNELKQFRYLL